MKTSTKNSSSREQLKGFFLTGKRPTQEDFSKWLDSSLIKGDDNIYCTEQGIGIGTKTPDAPLSIVKPLDTEKGEHATELSATFSLEGGECPDSVFSIGHQPGAGVVLGTMAQESLQLGHFDHENNGFTSYITLSPEGLLGIGTHEPEATVDIQGDKACVRVGRASLSKNKLKLHGKRTKIEFSSKSDSDTEGFAIQSSLDKWQLTAPMGNPDSAPIQVSKDGKVAIGGSSEQVPGRHNDTNILGIYGNTRIEGNTQIDGELHVSGKINSHKTDLQVKSVQLGNSNLLESLDVPYDDYTTHFVTLKNSALKLKHLQMGEGYSTEDRYGQATLTQNTWYTIAKLPFNPNVSVASTAAFMVNLKSINPNAESAVIFTVSVNNSEGGSLSQGVDINVTLNSNFLPETKGLSMEKIRISKQEKYLSLDILMGSLNFTKGSFAILHNVSPPLDDVCQLRDKVSPQPWLPAPWHKKETLEDDPQNEQSANSRPQDWVELALAEAQTSTTQGAQMFSLAEPDHPGINLKNTGEAEFSKSVRVKTAEGTTSTLLSPSACRVTDEGKGSSVEVAVKKGDGQIVLSHGQGNTGISLSATSEHNQISLGENWFKQQNSSLYLGNSGDDKKSSDSTLNINTASDVGHESQAIEHLSLQCGYAQNATFHITHPEQNLVRLGTNADSDLAFGNFNQGFKSHLRISSNGNIGLGTQELQQKLGVEGSGYFSEKLGIGVAHPNKKLEVDGSASIKDDLEVHGKIVLGEDTNTATLSYSNKKLQLTIGNQTFDINLTPASVTEPSK